MSGALLDTCAVIWMAGGRLPPDLETALDDNAATGTLFYSPVSAWEIGMLGRARKDGPRLSFDPDPVVWFERFRSAPGLTEIPLSSEIAMAAALLPTEVHADPADRFLIATARGRGLPLVTSDRRIIRCAAQGILKVIACRVPPDEIQ